MSHVGVDLFDFSGKKYVVCVDKWSGYPVYKRLQTVTTKALISVLEDWFNMLGWPSHLRSDGGPQFLGPFREWCKNNNILHEVSSPYNPKGNGLAEAAVKNVKNILAKCASTGQSPGKSLYAWRNVPRQDGYSPAQLLFGRRQLTGLPMLPCQFNLYDVKSAQNAKDNAFNSSAKVFNQHKLNLPQLLPGDNIVIQHPKTGLWDQNGSILSIRPDGLSYCVKVGGRECIRARHMIKKVGMLSSVASTSLPQHQLHTSDSASNFASNTLCANPVPNLSASSETRTDNQIIIRTSISPQELPGCSSTGPRLGAESAPFSSSSPCSSSYLCATKRTNVPQERQEERSFMSWSPLLPGAVDNPHRHRPHLQPQVDIPGLDRQVPMLADFRPPCPISVDQACSNFIRVQQPSHQVLDPLPSAQLHPQFTSLDSISRAYRGSTIIPQPHKPLGSSLVRTGPGSRNFPGQPLLPDLVELPTPGMPQKKFNQSQSSVEDPVALPSGPPEFLGLPPSKTSKMFPPLKKDSAPVRHALVETMTKRPAVEPNKRRKLRYRPFVF